LSLPKKIHPKSIPGKNYIVVLVNLVINATYYLTFPAFVVTEGEFDTDLTI
jgi:hypothetical protein